MEQFNRGSLLKRAKAREIERKISIGETYGNSEFLRMNHRGILKENIVE